MEHERKPNRPVSGRNRRRAIAAILALSLSISGSSKVVQASFVDSWISQSTTTDPSSFKGSQRNFYSGGGFSARWPQSNDHLLSITPRL